MLCGGKRGKEKKRGTSPLFPTTLPPSKKAFLIVEEFKNKNIFIIDSSDNIFQMSDFFISFNLDLCQLVKFNAYKEIFKN